MFFARYDVDGNLVWVSAAGGGDIEEGLGVAFDGSGNMAATGYFSDIMTFGTTDLTSTGESDIFFASYGSAGGSTYSERDGVIPLSTRVDPNFPNPFVSSTTIPVTLERPTSLRITVHDALGREVAILTDGRLSAGDHEVTLDASALPVGVYFVRVVTEDGSIVRRIAHIR